MFQNYLRNPRLNNWALDWKKIAHKEKKTQMMLKNETVELIIAFIHVPTFWKRKRPLTQTLKSRQSRLGCSEDLFHFWRYLKRNSFKNVSKGPAFLWQTLIQTIEYGLNDAIGVKKNEVIMIIYSFTSFDMNFQIILMPKSFW